MTYQIQDTRGNVVDRGLTYEEALLWKDQTFGNDFSVIPIMEDDQNDCDSLSVVL